MKRLLLAITIILLPMFASAHAGDPPLPPDEWNDDVALLLARAVVSEADWSFPDHAALAWTLKRRWEVLRATRSVSFADVVYKYCKGLSGKTATPRRAWVTTLPADLVSQPSGWSTSTDWDGVYRPLWARTYAFAKAWGEGRIADPCRGKSRHWGMRTGLEYTRAVQRGWQLVSCGSTANAFWTIPHGASTRRPGGSLQPLR